MAKAAKSQNISHIKDLIPDPANRRKHNPRNLGMVVDALHSVGAARSIVIDEDNVVLAGNGVTEAAAEAGITKVQVVDVDGSTLVAVRRKGLSDEQKRALAIYDNRTAELAEWNSEQLQADLAAGLSLQPWFSEEEQARLLKSEPKSGFTDPDAVPEERATDIKLGDLFQLGKHRLLCGDSTKAEDVARLMDGVLGDLLITSPPYNQSIDKFSPSGMHKDGGWVAKVERLAYSDSIPEEDYQQHQILALHVWVNILRDGASVFYNHKNRYREKQIVSPLTWLTHGPFKIRQEIIWSRPGSVTQNARMFLPSDERIYWLYKGSDFYFDDATEIKSWSTVWDVKLETNRTHAVAFPVELPSRAIKACSKVGETVIEPYCGSGTTMIACEQLDRRCFGSEIAPINCQVIIDRWEQFTQQKAVKVGEVVPA
jgi:DNA modification methylase